MRDREGTERQLTELALRIKGPAIFARAWSRVLREEERAQLGGDMEKCYEQEPRILVHLKNLRGYSDAKGVVEVAYWCGLMHPAKRRRLLEDIEVFGLEGGDNARD